MTAAEAQKQIDQVDAQIDAANDAIVLRLRYMPRTAGEWQTALDRCHDIEAARIRLFRHRGDLQVERDTAINREYRAQQRRERAAERKAAKFARCTACNGTGYQAAA